MMVGFKIEKILFLGDSNNSSISFSNPVHIVHGASNTGKSLLIEAIDYMLGTEELKQVLPESEKYNEVAMQVILNDEPFTVFRKWPSTTFEVYYGLIDSKNAASFFNNFKCGKATKKVSNISDFYLFSHKNTKISANLFGETGSLTIRLLSRVILSSEEKIISSDSPIIVGDTSENSKNKNVFKFLLTGNDDSTVKTIVRNTDFKSEKKGKVEELGEIVKLLKLDLEFKDESYESLTERAEKLDISIENLLQNIDSSQGRLSDVVAEKNKVSHELMSVSERINSISANLVNFETLKKLYTCDIDRLNSQEEAAFLLGIGHGRQCNFCGKTPDNICNDLRDLSLLADASKAEVNKIQVKYNELEIITNSLDQQLLLLKKRCDDLKLMLKSLDDEVERRAPDLRLEDNSLMTFREERLRIKVDLDLQSRINSINKRLQDAQSLSAPKNYKSEDFYPDSESIENFCHIYSDILNNIKFPGENKVEFDYKNFDVIIDGKPRKLNGKGVRAILHSIFKIALLKHCREKEIYHPGVVILDSPLVTYRDPLTSKYGELEKDEEDLAKTKVSYHFLNYLHQISHIGQFIIVDNIDIPNVLKDVIGIDTFYGKNASEDQRIGLL